MKTIVLLLVMSLFAPSVTKAQNKEMEKITLGAGCFWCVEAIFKEIKGVTDVESGYSNGSTKNPTYKEVCTGQTGYAEVLQVTFDPSIISLEELLTVFWHTHNPTTLNRQGADVGTQYRSAIFYSSDEQKAIAEESLKEVDQSNLWEDPIVTEIEPLKNYYTAEDYHQDYFENNQNQPYCSLVVAPKVQKFRKEFKHLLKN